MSQIHFSAIYYLTKIYSILSRNLVCGGYLTANRGLIKSPKINETMPNYPPNITCQWVIEARRGRIMKLTFTNVDILSSNTECHEDYLMVCTGFYFILKAKTKMNAHTINIRNC